MSVPAADRHESERRPELGALIALGAGELRDAVLGIGALHQAVAARAFGAAGARSSPAGRVHRQVAHASYTAVGTGVALAGDALAAAARHWPAPAAAGSDQPHELSRDPRGATLIAIIDGLIGDALEEQDSPLALPMSVRVDGRAVELDAAALADAFPAATGRLCVFVHGLMETEHAWRRGTEEPYATALQRELGLTPIELRLNTGRRVSSNGRALCELMQRLNDSWPCPVEQIAFVGHSMGGLVARSACHHAAGEGVPWVSSVRQLVSLGTPHHGAPLEQGVHVASAALDLLPETRPISRLLRRRSGGIRDLRRGSLVDEDWSGRDPDALRAAAVAEVPLLAGATHCFVAATVTRDPRHPLGRLVGDALVLSASASGWGRTRRLPFADEHGLLIGGANHFALLNHPEVHRRLREWLAEPAPPHAVAAR
ncbi:MAG TPA: hypothetical protein VHX88_19650 [Solirubrobacteraceae bacterium]|jgi:hypothetical protein|nr:hypothetical protein [Solirubrobacteraceae bacterium]